MKKIKWILQKNLTKSDVLSQIKTALKQDNVTWEEIEVIPFSNHLPPLKNENFVPIIYGSTTLMLNAFQHSDYQKGLFYNPATFQMQNYVRQWQKEVLNSDGFLIELGQISTIKSETNQSWFLRPNHDGKEFSGQVLKFEALIKWSAKICDLQLPDFNEKTEIWLSPPKQILKEWRLFIIDNEIISACRYAQNGELDESRTDIPEMMLTFANSMIQQYRLHDIYVMDIAEIKEGFKLIECNCFNGTGFYQHDIEAIIHAVNRYVLKKMS